MAWRGADRGYTLTFMRADAADLALTKFGEYLYDQLIFFAPSVSQLGGSVDVRKIMDFVASGRSLIVAASHQVGDVARELAAECGIDFDDEGTFVIDHVHYDASDAQGEHTLIVADDFLSGAEVIFGGKAKPAPVLFRGVSHALVSADPDGLLLEVLSASSTAYSHNPHLAVGELPLTVGKNSRLVTALQARNSARLVFTGSLEMFSNAFFSMQARSVAAPASQGAKQSGNAELLNALTAWAFLERGVLRWTNARHHKAGESAPSAVYRVLDDVSFSIVLEQWTGTEWKPFLADDVQLEFQMLDPYVRLTMKHDAAGRYSVDFKVPDVYGIFQFKVTYRRKGFTALAYAEQVTVRPFRHNEFERFIVQAYPYYASSFAMMGLFFVFSLVFLHHRSDRSD